MTGARIHWLRPDAQTGTACGLGGIVSERTPDVTCASCIEIAAREDRLVRVRASKRRELAALWDGYDKDCRVRGDGADDETQALADPWTAVREREF